MNPEEKYELITRNLQEIIGIDELRPLLNGNPSVYWGTMPTGSISMAYFFPMLKIGDFLKAGLKVKILLADLHAALDSVPWDLLEKRYDYYKEAIISILKTINVPLDKLEFVKGSEIQLNKNYYHDLLKLSTETTISKAKKSAAEVVKMGDNPKLSGLIYPLMQALDEEYLQVDMQFGGMDQRKIMVFAREYLPKIGYKARIELINPIIRGLIGEKMSSSIEGTKIDLLETEDAIKKKINKADCIAGDINNGLLDLLKYLIMIIKTDKKEPFIIERPEKYGGNLIYKDYESIENDFKTQKLHPMDLKNGVAQEIIKLLKPCRENKTLVALHEKAY